MDPRLELDPRREWETPLLLDTYAAAPTVLVCPSCGEALLPGDTYIRLRGDGEIIACEYCADVVRAQAP